MEAFILPEDVQKTVQGDLDFAVARQSQAIAVCRLKRVSAGLGKLVKAGVCLCQWEQTLGSRKLSARREVVQDRKGVPGFALPEQGSRQRQQPSGFAVALIHILRQGFFRPSQIAQEQQTLAFFEQQVAGFWENAVDEKTQVLLAERAGNFRDNPSVHEGFHGWHLLHLEAGSQPGLVIDVNTSQPEDAVCFMRQTGKLTRLHPAGDAPGRPQIEYNRHVC